MKSDSSTYVVCPPSIYETGYQYQIRGTKQIQILNEEMCNKLEDSLNTIYQNYSYNYYNQSTGKFLILRKDFKRMTKTLDIDSVKHKISNGSRNNTLLAIADSLIANHFTKSRGFLKSLFFEINQKICENPLEEKELESIWNQSTNYIKSSNDEKKLAKNYDSSKVVAITQTKEDSKNKKEYTIFKYTLDNKIYESAIVAGKPFFIAVDEEGEVILVANIEQETRILKPSHIEEYPSKPYVFESKEEIEKFVQLIKEKNVSIDFLFWKIKEFVSKFIVHQLHILDYISALILFSYFQDIFSTIPYTMFVSDGGSGKSTIGNVFEDLGYRCVNMTDPTTANIFRIFGTIEAGQCTLVLDEAEKIDQDKDMMSILKTGYEYGKRVQRTNQFGKQDHFHTFGLKILRAYPKIIFL